MLTFISVPYTPTRSPAASSFHRQPEAVCSTLSSSSSAFLNHRPPHLLLSNHFPRPASRRARVSFVPTAILSGGGILGVGPAEVVVIAAVGWFVLGPEKLYSLSKDIGKLIGDLRRTANEARDSFTEALEIELEDEVDKTAKIATDDAPDPSVAIFQSVQKEGNVKVAIDKSLANEEDHNNSNVNGIDNINEKDNDDGLPAVIQTPEAAGLSGDIDISPIDEADDSEVTDPPSLVFLDQLKRVSDPNQVPPADVPESLDVSLDMDEQEVERLEKEYMEARERLNARRNVNNMDSDGLDGHGGADEASEANSTAPPITSINDLTDQTSSKRTDVTS